MVRWKRARSGRPGNNAPRYSPDQPRAPAGSPDGGQWTGGGGSDGGGLGQVALNTISNVVNDAGAIFVGHDDLGRYAIDLQTEEGYGHTSSRHVAKADEELLNILRKDHFKYRSLGITYIDYKEAHGSLLSRESANDFVNRTLEDNKDLVDLVVSGGRQLEVLERLFGYVTGKEAFRASGNSEPEIRRTYGVRVVIHHDPTSGRGYRVRTAFPFNPRRR